MQALLALALGTALTGIDVGWQPIEEGGLEYIVQIEPETLARLKPGDELATGIRPVLRDVRRYRIVIGKGPLPRIALPENPAAAPSSSSQPRPAPVPLATADPERSIVVPAEPGSTVPRSTADNAAAASAPPASPPPARIAVAPRPATTVAPAPVAPPKIQPSAAVPSPARVVPDFNAAPAAAPAPLKLPGEPVVNGWQPAGAGKSAGPAAKSEVPSPTLNLEDPKITPPNSLKLNENTAEPKRASPPPAPVKKETPDPAAILGDRYRTAESGPQIENNPPRQLKASDDSLPPDRREPPAGRESAGDRYRDLLAPPAIQPKAPADSKGDPSADAAKPAEERIVAKPKAATQQMVGPLLPPAAMPGAPPQPQRAAAPPTFDFDGVADVKQSPLAKPAAAAAPPGVEEKRPVAEENSRRIAENFGARPATLVNDPAVQPASVEPTNRAKISAEAATTGKTAEPPSPPWLPLTITLFVLFASLGGNVFLGWVAHDARARYGLLQRQRLPGTLVPAQAS